MNIQEREHWDHEMGCHDPYQNALALSRMEAKPGDEAQIKELLASGQFPVCVDFDTFCPFTDAYLKRIEVLVKVFDSAEEADKWIEQNEPNEYYRPQIVEPTPYVYDPKTDDTPF